MMAPPLKQTLRRLGRVASPLLLLAALQLTPPNPAHAEPAALVSQMIAGVNQARYQYGMAPLVEDTHLNALAFERSLDMVTRGYFSHVTPDGNNIFMLLNQRGIPWMYAGENLAWDNASEAQVVPVALQLLWNSPSHRANILGANFRQIGVGVAQNGDRTYFTLVFLG